MPASEPDQIPGDYQFTALHHGPSIQRFWHRNKFQALRTAIDEPVDLVVDVGCGSGNLLYWSGLTGRHAFGIDVSLAALRFCMANRAGRSASFAQALGAALPLRNAVADLVLLVEVLEHLTDPAAVLREIRRVLKPGGRLFLTTPNYAFPSPWPVIEYLADRSGAVAQMGGAQHVQRFSVHSLRQLLEVHDFRIERLGTMYLWSPLVSLVSSRWADRIALREITGGLRHGSLIHCVASTARG